MDVLYFQIEGAPYAIAQETIADVAPEEWGGVTVTPA